MPNNPKAADNLVPFTGADDPRRGSKPKGSKHISTWIQEMLNDEEFEANILDSKKGMIEYKGAPLKAIIGVAVQKAINDPKTGNAWAEWLAKHGYGNRLVIEAEDPALAALKKLGLVDDAGQDQGTEKAAP